MRVGEGAADQRLKILVTGGRGLLGRQVVQRLKEAPHEVRSYAGDVRHIHGLTDRYDVVCHLAGITKVDAERDAQALFEVNVGGTAAIMEYCRRAQARCVFASSSAVYKPLNNSEPRDESSIVEPGSLYGISKACAEDVCRYYADHLGVPTLVLRIFNLYGPGQSSGFLIPYVLGQLFRGEAVVLKTPDAVRDFVYVDDAAQAVVRASAYAPGVFTVMNVGTGRGLCVRGVVERIASQMRITPEVRVPEGRRPRPDAVVANVQRIEERLDWRAEVDIEQGLGYIIESEQSLKAAATSLE